MIVRVFIQSIQRYFTLNTLNLFVHIIKYSYVCSVIHQTL